MTPAQDAIERMHAMFGEPRTINPDRFLQEFEKALTGIEARVLEKAIDRVMKRSVFWPKPAEVIEEANSVAAALYSHKPIDWEAVDRERAKGWSVKDLPLDTPEARALHDDLMRTWKACMDVHANGGEPADDTDWKHGQREGFEEMQATSPNWGLHRK